MKKTVIPLLLSLVAGLATPAFAQDPASTQDSAPAPSAEAVGRLDDLDAEIDEYVQSWRKEQMAAYEKFQEEAKKAEEEGKPKLQMPAMSMRPEFGPFVERLMGWAEEKGGEDAALYYTKVVELDGLGEDSTGRDAFDRLVNDHAESPSWARLGSMLSNLERMIGEERTGEVFAILRESPSGNVRGWVVLIDNTDAVENAETDSERYAKAKAAMLAAIKEADDKALIEEIQGVIDLREKFGIGATAPDIVGIDLDGVEFKLSDYKGKIVFLDFWGDW